jgi:cytochrome c biogenesis protein CcdA/thiol-disulfide isomerase/thioredoxin
MTFFIISFIAGILTILAPCILPLLPVIVGKSVSDSTLSKWRVVIIVLSLGISVILFTLLLKVSTLFVNIPQNFWAYISGGIILIFGLVTLFPRLWEKLPFTSKLNQSSNKVLMSGYQKNNIWGDVVVGASLGPIFSACSPTYFVILATVLPVRPALGMVYLLSYTVGLCLALLLVALLGQRIMMRLDFAVDPNGVFKKILGIIFILVSIGILTGYDKKLQISILNTGFLDVTKLEQKILDANNKQSNEPASQNDDAQFGNESKNKSEKGKTEFLTLQQKKEKFLPAPEISTPDGFINTDGKPVTIFEFKGKKVVLLDFWTYSCINCQRTVPYLNEWYKKYEDDGLVIIGLSTPEFAFERVLKNVEDATKSLGIKYPVVLDNDFSTWNAYQNQYWPREYLIDIDGYIVHDHAGEGDYDITEQAIQSALSERNSRLGIKSDMNSSVVDPSGRIEVEPNKVNSPETYFGSNRNEYLENGNTGTAGTQNLVSPSDIKPNKLYLSGTWLFNGEYAENKGGGSVFFKYRAKNVYLVASSPEGGSVEVYIDGKLIDTIFIQAEKLYNIIKGADYGEHTLELKIKSPGIQAYTFTFG